MPKKINDRSDLDDLSTTFKVYGDGAFQMFNWLMPFIKKAGYEYHVMSLKDDILTIHKP